MAGFVLAAAVLICYGNTLSAPFIFDDQPGIVANASIRHLSDLGAVLMPSVADGSGVAGRPLVNLSLAFNYALGGLEVQDYHVVNLGIHLLAALVLFGLVRRTLTGRTDARSALGQAWLVALLWSLHPLLTESVTCVIQRTESLMGLCYLLTVYGFVRAEEAGLKSCPAQSPAPPPGQGARGILPSLGWHGAAGWPQRAVHQTALEAEPPERRFWRVLSVGACLCGMAAKETMVTAPVVVLLFDYTFIAGSFRTLWQARQRYYLALFATWILLAVLVVHAGGKRGSAAGFNLGISPFAYALTQTRAIGLYLKLALWPSPLVLDYGHPVVSGVAAVVPQLLLLLILLAASVWALSRPATRAIGFLGAVFFALLAPSSSIVPLVTQTIAEHRMYLPLIAIVVLVVVTLHRLVGRRVFVAAGLVLMLGLGVATARRNETYRTALSIWTDTVAKAPTNPRAHNNLGLELAKSPARAGEAMTQYRTALALDPHYPEAHNNLAISLDNSGQSGAAIAEYRAALHERPSYPEAQIGLAVALSRAGQSAEAIPAFERALRLSPGSAEAHYNFAAELEGLPGRLPQAILEYETALRLEPHYAEAQFNLGNALAATPGREAESIAHYQAAIALKPHHPEAYNNLALVYARSGQIDLAVQQLRIALQLDPNFAGARQNLAQLQSLK